MKKAKLLAALLAAMILSTACATESTTDDSGATDTSGSTDSSTTAEDDTNEEDEPAIDMEEVIDISWYTSNFSSAVTDSLANVRAYQEYGERNNVNIDWQHPATGTDGNEQLNLMIASNDLPDVVFWNWNGMPGKITKYIDDGNVIPLNDYMEYAPDYQARLDEYPDVAKVVPLDDGTIPAFYQLDPDPRRTTYAGLMIRTDWLDALNLEVPETMDDWHTVLTAFKNDDPNGNGQQDEIPWSEAKGSNLSAFTAAFGIYADMYINPETGMVDYGPYNSEAYKEFLTTMNQWYNEGLIDAEFPANDSKILTANMTSGISGATFGYVNGGIGNYTRAAIVNDPDYEIMGIPSPVGDDGVNYMVKNDHLMKIGWGATISNGAENVERIVSLLNYGYSEEGNLLLNYGIEGESYEMIDGEPQFMDFIINPEEEDKTRAVMASMYASPINGFAKVMNFDAQAAVQYEIETQEPSIENWLDGDSSLMLHPNMTLTSEESEEYSLIFSEVKTYVDEMTQKFITGDVSLDEYENYISAIENMNVERMIEIYQVAYDRFLER